MGLCQLPKYITFEIIALLLHGDAMQLMRCSLVCRYMRDLIQDLQSSAHHRSPLDVLPEPIHTTHRVKPITFSAVGRSTPEDDYHCHLEMLPISSDGCNQALIRSSLVDSWPGLATEHVKDNEFSKVYCCHGDGFYKSQKIVDIYFDIHPDRHSRVSAHVTRAKPYPESSSRNFFDNDHNFASPMSKRRWLSFILKAGGRDSQPKQQFMTEYLHSLHAREATSGHRNLKQFALACYYDNRTTKCRVAVGPVVSDFCGMAFIDAGTVKRLGLTPRPLKRPIRFVSRQRNSAKVLTSVKLQLILGRSDFHIQAGVVSRNDTLRLESHLAPFDIVAPLHLLQKPFLDATYHCECDDLVDVVNDEQLLAKPSVPLWLHDAEMDGTEDLQPWAGLSPLDTNSG